MKPGLQKGFVGDIRDRMESVERTVDQFEEQLIRGLSKKNECSLPESFEKRIKTLEDIVETNKKCITQIHDGQHAIRLALEGMPSDDDRKNIQRDVLKNINQLLEQYDEYYEKRINRGEKVTTAIICCLGAMFTVQFVMFLIR